MDSNALVLDANILIRAVLGERVFELLLKYADTVRFFAPEPAFLEAEEHLPRILASHGIAEAKIIHHGSAGIAIAARVRPFVEVIPDQEFISCKVAALARLARRDPEDWPILAAALALNCPIWTEDTDFFGTGVATWTTDRIEIWLESRAAMK